MKMLLVESCSQRGCKFHIMSNIEQCYCTHSVALYEAGIPTDYDGDASIDEHLHQCGEIPEWCPLPDAPPHRNA